jgi:siroheme decarboxylase
LLGKIKTMLTNLERKILDAIQSGLPMSPWPYEELSKTIGIPANQVLDTLRQWKAEGKIRRLGAIMNHFQMGHGVGAMMVWKVPENRIDSIGELFASFPAVSHAYLRPVAEQWPYNLYTMVHARDDRELEGTIEAMSRQSGITEFRALKTIRELKKVPPTYIE